jgi:hypothetical protein
MIASSGSECQSNATRHSAAPEPKFSTILPMRDVVEEVSDFEEMLHVRRATRRFIHWNLARRVP